MRKPASHTTDERPTVDVTDALGEAGHEQEILGYVGVADSGPLVDDHGDGDDRDTLVHRLAAVIARHSTD